EDGPSQNAASAQFNAAEALRDLISDPAKEHHCDPLDHCSQPSNPHGRCQDKKKKEDGHQHEDASTPSELNVSGAGENIEPRAHPASALPEAPYRDGEVR